MSKLIVEANNLYQQLLGNDYHKVEDKTFDWVTDRLIELVIEEANKIAEGINRETDIDRIIWLLEQGYTWSDIKDFVGKIE